MKQRRCLRCGEMFESSGSYNRICNNCKKKRSDRGGKESRAKGLDYKNVRKGHAN